jgi:hypothetical protein
MNRVYGALLIAALGLTALAGGVRAAGSVELEVDCARTGKPLRALHGVNKGPLAAGGLLDVTEPLRALGIPLTRLHDCHWPNPDVVDMHVVFPDPNADPERPESYDFRLTDEYVAAVRATGSEIVYRLGESIEHTSVKRFVHPPKDAERWARAALGIIRHYNDGWANGFHYNIRYWEIWNEPENRPVMWTGSDAEYFHLYHTAARAIKARYPELKVGGPAVGYSGQFAGGQFQPSEFVGAFLDGCRQEQVPLDFFSWHCYTGDASEPAQRAQAIRKLLDEKGFTRTESHLNEWNYLPDGKWDGGSRSATPAARQRFYEQMAGPRGAAFLTTGLLQLQEAPLDAANLFHGEVGGFGLFSEHGVPNRCYEALLAFHQVQECAQSVEARGSMAGQLAVAAGLTADKRSVRVLVSNYRHPASSFRLHVAHLPWRGDTVYQVRQLDEAHSLPPAGPETALRPDGALELLLKAPGVALVTLRPR